MSSADAPSPAPDTHWLASNQRYLLAALARVQRRLEAHAGPGIAARPAETDDGAEDAVAMPAPAALQELCARLSLTGCERDLLLLCAGVELDGTFAACCAAAQVERHPYPSFGLALAVLPGAH